MKSNPQVTGYGRDPATMEVSHFDVEFDGIRIVVAKTADGRWKAGRWRTIEEIANDVKQRDGLSGHPDGSHDGVSDEV